MRMISAAQPEKTRAPQAGLAAPGASDSASSWLPQTLPSQGHPIAGRGSLSRAPE